MKYLKLYEEFNQPDWHSGYEFGKPRNDFDKIPKSTATKQKKIDKFEKKRDKIISKSKKDKNLQVSVRKHIMSNIEKVNWRDSLKLIDTAIKRIENIGSTGGIIIYI